MAGLSFIQNAASSVLGDVATTLLTDAIGGMSGVFFRAAPTAGRLFGVGSENYTFHTSSMPRPGFMYMVKFISPLTASTTRTGFDPSTMLSSKTGFNFQAKSVDRPNTQMTTEVVNEYNKKRIIYTGRTHSPVNMVFYDDVAGKLLKFWQSYFAHYFNDGTLKSTDHLFWDNMANIINDPGTDGFGLRTIAGTTEKYYFDKIVIYQFFGGYYTTITLFNPMISNFQYSSQLTYEEGANLPEVTITFEYENVAYDMDPKKVTTQEASDFGFQYDYNQPPLGISTQKVAGYLDAFLRKNGIDGTVGSTIGSALGLGNTTTGRIADNILRSVITNTVSRNTSKNIKNTAINVGINAFSDLVNGAVNYPANKKQSTTGAFPLDTQYSDNGKSDFSTQMSAHASKLLNTGLYSQLSTFTSQVDQLAFKSTSLLATDSAGRIQFTEKGLAGMNSLLSQSTVLGVSTANQVASSVGSAVKSASSLKNLFG